MTDISSPSDLITWVAQSNNTALRDFTDSSTARYIARAPGRLDLMGGIADYSGSLVLQWPIREATWAILQPTTDQTLHIASVHVDTPDILRQATHQLEALADNGSTLTYSQARDYFASDRDTKWSAYVAGVFPVLMRERGAQFSSGARILLVSDVPEGKGVSSSAALEVATMTAVADAFGLQLSASDIGALCQMVENEVVGAPCGIMDQMASSCAESGSLMALRCRPASSLAMSHFPKGPQIWGIDSGVRHSVSGADYGTVRTAAFMGLAIVEQIPGISLGGYLTKLSPSEVEPYVDQLPISITGGQFKAQFGSVSDPQSLVHPDRSYPVRAATLHPINEHQRVKLFRELLSLPTTPKRLSLLGELMYEAHNSYSACGLGTAQTDLIVKLARDLGPRNGLYGAKITGGGSGGTVAVLGESGRDYVIEQIAATYQAQTGLEPYIFTGTSPGASVFGVTKL